MFPLLLILSALVGGSPRIVVDPGHGGSDPGAVGNGLQEKDVTLDVALRLADLLDADTLDPHGGGAWEVLLTRASDVDVSLADRVALANGWRADRFVSIHANAFGDPAANGTETYVFATPSTAADMGALIQEEMLAAWGLTDRGLKTANFFVLVNTQMPASLSELGFITNPGDAAFLADPVSRQRAALAHLFALQRHYGLAPYEPSSGAPEAYCVAKTNSQGCTPFIGSDGSPTATGPDDFHITAQLVRNQQFGILFWGLAPTSTPFAGGTLCVQAPLTRTPIQNAGGTTFVADCSGTYDLHFTQALLAAEGLVPGTWVYAQYWQRDPALGPPDPVGLTDALRFRVGP